jgi:excisionase family DNA binding protein
MEISIKDAAELLGKSERTVRHMAQTGRLPARRIGARWLINREDLLQRKASGVTDSDEDVTDIPDVDAEADLSDDSGTAGQTFTVNWHAPPRNADHVLPPGEITSVRELDSFHIATAVLAKLGEVRRDAVNGPLLRDAETHLREFLHLLADGCHADLGTRRDRFREAQSRVCAALTDIIHFNVVRPEPDLGPLAQRLERDLIGELRSLIGDTSRRLSWRGRAISLAETTLARVLTRLRGFAGEGRVADRLGGLQRTLTQALHSAR